MEEWRVRRVLPVLLFALLSASPSYAWGQERDGPPRDAVGSRLEIGARVGVDYQNDVAILGGQLRISVDPWRRIDFLPSAELTFQEGLTERQYNLDGAFYLDGTRTLYVGGGAAFRNTYYLDGGDEPLAERETRVGANAFGGVHLAPFRLPLTVQVEGRWTFIDDFRPQTLIVGVNYAIPLGL
jgi:hypothetical protein